MRTTVNLDDVLFAVQARARREHRTAGQILTELAQTLTGQSSDAPSPERVLGFAPLPSRGAAVSNELIDRLRDDEAV